MQGIAEHAKSCSPVRKPRCSLVIQPTHRQMAAMNLLGPHRFVCDMAGRGGGKTFIGVNTMIRDDVMKLENFEFGRSFQYRRNESKRIYWHVCPSLQQFKNFVWPEWMACIHPSDVEYAHIS